MDTILRIRIDEEIARRAREMADARAMPLADIVRLMLTKAVQIDDFSIEKELSDHRQLETQSTRQPYFEYEQSHWNSMKTVLDAELALALVNQYLASRTLEMEALADHDPLQVQRLAQLSRERDRARQVLATLDPTDQKSVQAILQEFAPGAEPVGPSVADEAGEGES